VGLYQYHHSLLAPTVIYLYRHPLLVIVGLYQYHLPLLGPIVIYLYLHHLLERIAVMVLYLHHLLGRIVVMVLYLYHHLLLERIVGIVGVYLYRLLLGLEVHRFKEHRIML
jgi:hypothetical protein